MGWRSSIGTQLDPNSCWMLMRSLETLEIRMTRSNDNARLVAEYLAGHPKIARVHYLGFLKEGDPRKNVFDRQCSAPGSTFAFDVKGGERECANSGHPDGDERAKVPSHLPCIASYGAADSTGLSQISAIIAVARASGGLTGSWG